MPGVLEMRLRSSGVRFNECRGSLSSTPTLQRLRLGRLSQAAPIRASGAKGGSSSSSSGAGGADKPVPTAAGKPSHSPSATSQLLTPVPEVDATKTVLRWAFPAYLQSTQDDSHCDGSDDTFAGGDIAAVDAASRQLWKRIRTEAVRDAKSEPLLASFLDTSILQHDSFEASLAFVLASRLASHVLPVGRLFDMFKASLSQDQHIRCYALADVEACYDRDPACTSYSQALLYLKGFHAIQVQRIAHALWLRGQKITALALQSRMSEVFAVDIHPGALLGRGLLLDHGTGVVIGETAVIGKNCSLMQNITLGGTGKQSGDRHPKLMDNVLVGASSTILGNIVIGKGSQVGAGSLVLKAVDPHTMVAGSPSQVVGRVTGNPAMRMQHNDEKFMSQDPFLNDRRLGTVARAPNAAATASATTAQPVASASPASLAVPAEEAPPAPASGQDKSMRTSATTSPSGTSATTAAATATAATAMPSRAAAPQTAQVVRVPVVGSGTQPAPVAAVTPNKTALVSSNKAHPSAPPASSKALPSPKQPSHLGPSWKVCVEGESVGECSMEAPEYFL